MNTKKMVCIFSILLAGILVPLCCFSSLPTGKITIRVVDEDLTPITNAYVSVTRTKVKNYQNPWEGQKSITEKGQTSSEGLFVSSGKGFDTVYFSAKHEGMYDSFDEFTFKNAENLKWQPWNPTVTLKLRKIENPIPMYAKSILEMNCPAASFDYDLIKGDFLPPHGTGEIADCHFELSREVGGQTSEGVDWYRQKLIFTFGGEFNGLTPVSSEEMDQQSDFRWPRYAYENDYSLQMLTIQSETKSPPREHFFRIRSEKNLDGTFKSAFYGKMVSPNSSQIWTSVREKTTTYTIKNFVFYVNSTRNDRNMEFDAAHDKNLSYPRGRAWSGQEYGRTIGYKNGEQRVTAP